MYRQFVLLSLLGGLATQVSAQEGPEIYNDYWQKMDSTFRNPEKSPLPVERIADFDSISRYSYNPSFRTMAKWEALDRQKPFQIETTTERRPRYQTAGVLHFVIESDTLKLPVYRSLENMRAGADNSHIFVPFTDLSNGEGTYMGGRYLDLKTPESDSLVVDFNLAYNPYCVYSERYSCPIPPKENHLPVFIAAGAKTEY